MKRSKTCEQLLNDGFGYRNDDISTTTSTTPLWEILEYEINELGNDDVFDYLQSLGMNFISVDEVINYIYNTLHLPYRTPLYGMWLTTKENVLDFYHNGENNEITISKYSIPENALIISDLDCDGILFVLCKPKDDYYESEYTTIKIVDK